MQTKTLTSGQTIRYYSDIDEFPIDRRTAWVKYLTLAGGMDHSLPTMADRVAEISARIAKGSVSDAQTLCTNLYMSIKSVEDLDLPPDALALGVLIGEANGIPCRDMSEAGLAELMRTVAPTQKEVDEILSDVKKNSWLAGPSTSRILLGM